MAEFILRISVSQYSHCACQWLCQCLSLWVSLHVNDYVDDDDPADCDCQLWRFQPVRIKCINSTSALCQANYFIHITNISKTYRHFLFGGWTLAEEPLKTHEKKNNSGYIVKFYSYTYIPCTNRTNFECTYYRDTDNWMTSTGTSLALRRWGGIYEARTNTHAQA